MRPDQNEQRRQCRRAGADPIRQRGDIEIDAFTRISLALPVQRQMVRELRFRIIASRFGPARPREIG